MNTTILEDNLDEVQLHLRHAYRAMRRLMAVSADWAAQAQVEEEFRNLRDACRDFARFQYGIPSRSPRRRGRGYAS
jgi:hypothetical protein